MSESVQVQLENWSVIRGSNDPFQAPEQAVVVLKGIVRGHPLKPDGSSVRTNQIVAVNGRIVRTNSGSIYRLGEPSAKYRKWLSENRPEWDPENPIRLW